MAATLVACDTSEDVRGRIKERSSNAWLANNSKLMKWIQYTNSVAVARCRQRRPPPPAMPAPQQQHAHQRQQKRRGRVMQQPRPADGLWLACKMYVCPSSYTYVCMYNMCVCVCIIARSITHVLRLLQP